MSWPRPDSSVIPADAAKGGRAEDGGQVPDRMGDRPSGADVGRAHWDAFRPTSSLSRFFLLRPGRRVPHVERPRLSSSMDDCSGRYTYNNGSWISSNGASELSMAVRRICS
jgi:hypothetical protein